MVPSEVNSASENEYQGFLLGLMRPVCLADDLPPLYAESRRSSRALTYPELLGPIRPVAGDLYFFFIGAYVGM